MKIAFVQILFCGLLLCAGEIYAKYHFDSWNTENGLPQSTVRSILQTRDGYLWLATHDGLVRYDGARFTVFNKINSPGIKNNRLTTLFESADGSLWIGTDDGSAMRFRDGTFTTFPTDDAKVNLIWAFIEDPQIGLIARRQEGMLRWDGERFVPYVFEQFNDSPQVKRRVKNSFALFDENDLYVFNEGHYQNHNFSNSKIMALAEDQRGVLWFKSEDGNLIRFENSNFTVFPLGKLADAKLTTAHQDRAGNIWVGFRDGRVSVRDNNGVWTTFDETQNAPRREISSIYEDREGTVWIGSFSEGLFRLQKQTITTISQQEGLTGENVYPIFETSDGAVWFGVWFGGLFRLKDGNLTRYNTLDGFKGTIFTALYEDRSGNLLVGGTQLYRFENNRFNVLLESAFFNNTGIYVIAEDRMGNLWLGTQVGLFKFKDGNLERFTTAEGLPHQTVQAIREDRLGNLWLGTLGGLAVLRAGDGTIQAFTEAEGLASNHVRAIYEDADGVLWIGTYDGGISRFAGGKFTNYTTANGLSTNGAFQILEDDDGRFWISSNLGIYRTSRREMNEFAAGERRSINSISYGTEDGLLSLECNGGKQPAGVKTRDGRLWFPTQRGVAVIDPSNISFNPHPPPVMIESIEIDNQPISFERDESEIPNPKSQIEIAPGQSNLEIAYTALSFIKPENVRFRYRLENLDADWVDAETRRTAYYSYIPPGRYVFHVIAANADGVWNETGARISLVVLPPFWRTWWFYGLLIFGTIVAGFLIYNIRVSRLKRAHAAQEAFSRKLIESQEAERKRIAAELHDGLGQSLVIIKNRAVLGFDRRENTERAFEQLDEIASAASEAINEVREITYNLRPYQLDRLGLTKAIESMLKRASHEIKFETEIDSIDKLFPKESEINVYRIVQESVNNIIKHSEATEAKIKIKRNADAVEITIQDNGKGFDTNNGSGGFGLLGIAERTRMLGGEFHVSSILGAGTAINIKLKQ